jgi:hypothetical protein
MANVVMVPRPTDPVAIAQNVPVNFLHQQRQYGVPQEVDMAIKTLQATVSVPMMGSGGGHDPWYDYRLFYHPHVSQDGQGPELHVYFADIDSRFWSRADFRDILLEVPETILVQPTHSGWRIGFETMDEGSNFQGRYLSTVKQHQQKIECTFEQWVAMNEWINNNVLGPKFINHTQRGSDVTVSTLIKNYDEAMHFKLRWHNIKEVEASLEEQD